MLKQASILPQPQTTPATVREVLPQESLNQLNIHSLQGLPVQRKLIIGSVDDPLEEEADAMADKVMRMPEDHFIQRKCENCEEEQQVHRKRLTSFIQRKANPAGSAVSDVVTSQIQATRGGGSPLSATTKSFMESRFGTDFSAVRIHSGNEAKALSDELNAQAFTVGSDIYFNSRKYAPQSFEGKYLLAHELTHTLQQDQNLIQRNVFEEQECNYVRGEKERSHSSEGHLTEDVVELGDGRLLIADFGIDWRHVKPAIASNPLFRTWDALFAGNDAYQIQIVGYSDCVGNEMNNTRLRQARAQNFENILSPEAKNRVTFRGMAGLGNYIYANNSVENRAKNRGVIIRFSQQMDFETHEVTLTRLCGPDITQWLVNQLNTNKDHPVIRTAREVEWPRYVPFFNLGWTYGFLDDFRALVRAGGPWDFKSRQGRPGTGEWRAATGRGCPNLPCDTTVTMCGMCFNYDVPGNIHYGWVGVAAGLRPWFLHNRADAAQAGGVDDPRDTVAIDIGINMYDNGTTLCDELRLHRNDLNLSRTDNCRTCS